MDVVALEHCAGQVRLVRIPTPKPLESDLFVAESLKECVWERGWVEWRFRELGNSFFDFDCIHANTKYAFERQTEVAKG